MISAEIHGEKGTGGLKTAEKEQQLPPFFLPFNAGSAAGGRMKVWHKIMANE
jgi:hypothetical protein